MHFDQESLRRVRKARNLSQEQLAVKAGVVSSTISRLERGEVDDPAMATILRLADALEVDVVELITTDGAAA